MTTPKWTQEQTIYERSHITTKYDGELHEGVVVTRNGYVKVESRWYPSQRWTLLEFIHDGSLWVRCFDHFYSPRYLVTLARRFARDVAEGHAESD
jgi:hypothetical protein